MRLHWLVFRGYAFFRDCVVDFAFGLPKVSFSGSRLDLKKNLVAFLGGLIKPTYGGV
jgi:hypothetical protein